MRGIPARMRVQFFITFALRITAQCATVHVHAYGVHVPFKDRTATRGQDDHEERKGQVDHGKGRVMELR